MDCEEIENKYYECQRKKREKYEKETIQLIKEKVLPGFEQYNPEVRYNGGFCEILFPNTTLIGFAEHVMEILGEMSLRNSSSGRGGDVYRLNM